MFKIDLLDLFMSEGYHELPEVDGTKISHPIMIFNEEEKEKILAPPKIVLTKEHMFSCFYKWSKLKIFDLYCGSLNKKAYRNTPWGIF